MAELGNKHTCDECETKFYDLGKPNAACPQCGKETPVETAKSSKTKRAAPAPKPKAAPKPTAKDSGDDASAELEEE